MSIVEILLISLLIVLGILASITDTREGRIYNKTLLIFAKFMKNVATRSLNLT